MRWKIIFLITITSAILCYHEVNPNSKELNSSREVESVPQNHDYDDYEDTEPKDKEVEVEGEVEVEETEKIPDVSVEPVQNIPSVVTVAVNTSGLLPLSARSGKLTYEYLSPLDLNDQNYDWNDPYNRFTPSEPPTHQGDAYIITAARLKEVRDRFLYPFHDRGGSENLGDYQRHIHNSNPQVHKNFNYQLPFFGFRFNYTRVSMNGFLEFSDPPEYYTYPLTFPVKDWPKKNDPSFIGIFHSKCRIGRIPQEDRDQRTPGIYFRMERDLMERKDRYGVEMRERVMWDIREGVVGSETFIPKHVAIITWKNMSFAGGIDNSLFNTNSFQMILATDEVFTYAIFNYILINWSSHTEAGGDTTGGEGGVPAYIGFNAGNGTQAYEYRPYSQTSVLRDLTGRGWANGFPGRHIFRIDEKIMLGTCNKDIDAANLPLVFAPEYGNMLGGTVVNITGPCFDKNERVSCRFDTEEVIGHVVDRNRAICVQPFLKAQGYVRFEISIGTERYKWRGKFFVETPAAATDRIFFDGQEIHQKAPKEIKITWNKYNLTTNLNANIQISLWGYRENTIRPELLHLGMIEESIINNGHYTINPDNYRLRENPNLLNMEFGFLHINLTNPEQYSGLKISPVLWSKPIPLGWYFGPQWQRKHGKNWPRALCDNWIKQDRYLKNFAADLPLCPCTLDHALYDKGRFMPDLSCDRDLNPSCTHHKGAIHCVRSGQPSYTGSEQQCCYDRNKFLMLSYDQMWGSRVRKVHDVGQMPWNEAGKVPTLSQWFHDVKAYYSCCMWQDEQAVGCETFRFERRPSQDCIAYQPPAVAGVFGDPHIVTFDNIEYTFNGMGEFVLLKGNNGKERVDVQARFEQVHKNIYGPVMATHLTSIAVRGNTSTVIEIRLRPKDAQWRYHLDVFADEKRIYFDRESLRKQFFHGVTVYTPSYVLNQSEIVVMLSSGVGVEVVENEGFMTARVYLPWSFINKTRGLLGNWSWDVEDEFTLPDGTISPVNLNDFEHIHKNFALKWMLADRDQDAIGAALFVREFGKTSSSYANSSFIPNYKKEIREFLSANRSQDIEKAYDLCGDSYQCKFDYGMSLDREMAYFTKNYHASITNIRAINNERLISCGILETPRFGRKTNFLFTPGTRVSFECNEGFTLTGDMRRECTSSGRWDTPIYGHTTCLRNVYYTQRTAWITIGIIFCVILPILMIIVCVIYCWRKKHLKEDPSWKIPIPSRSGSRSTLRNLGSDADDDTIKKVRNYDGTYRTHEPLEGKPNIEFPAKKLDLDEDDLDVTSSEGGSEYKDKVAKDFEYRNTKPELNQEPGSRILGRREQRQKAIEEEEMPPPPIDQLNNNPPVRATPGYTTYSPTYSQNDRNSFMTDPSQSPPNFRVNPMQPRQQFFGPGPVSPPPISQSVGLPTVSPPPGESRSTQV